MLILAATHLMPGTLGTNCLMTSACARASLAMCALPSSASRSDATGVRMSTMSWQSSMTSSGSSTNINLKEQHHTIGYVAIAETTRQIRTPVLRIPPAVTSQAKMKN